MTIVEWAAIGCLIVYVAVCFGKIAGKRGNNPILYGLLSVISPVNLIILGIWAFSKCDADHQTNQAISTIGQRSPKQLPR
jgi:hypothetical protein